MASNSIQYTIGVDNSKFLTGFKQAEGTVKNFGSLIQKEFSQKLKSVIAVTAIEQAVQRTAEWAQRIDQTSKALGITAEQLQYIQLLTKKTSVSEEAAMSMFDNISKAQQEAIDGNIEMITSFAKLGIQINDLKNMTKTQLFTTFLGKAGAIGMNNPDIANRQAMSKISGGTSENIIMGMAEGVSGSPSMQDAVDSGELQTNEDISTLSQSWTNFVQSMKDAVSGLMPLATILLSLVTTIVNGIGGIITFISEGIRTVFDLLKGNWTGVEKHFKNFTGILMNIGYGLVKIVTSVLDFITQKLAGGWLGKKIGLASITDEINKEQDEANKGWGTKGKIQRQGEGIADVMTMAGSLPAGTLRSGVGYASRSLGQTLQNQGLKSIGSSIETKGNSILKTLQSEKDALLKKEIDVMKKNLDREGIYQSEFNGTGNTAIKGMDHQMEAFMRKQAASSLAKTRISRKLFMGGAAAGFINTSIAGLNIPKGTPSLEETPFAKNQAGFNMPNVSSGGAMLRMGGMMGAGDNKIIKLNQEMVKLLSLISKNTATFGVGRTVPMSNPGGSVSLGGAAAGI